MRTAAREFDSNFDYNETPCETCLGKNPKSKAFRIAPHTQFKLARNMAVCEASVAFTAGASGAAAPAAAAAAAAAVAAAFCGSVPVCAPSPAAAVRPRLGPRPRPGTPTVPATIAPTPLGAGEDAVGSVTCGEPTARVVPRAQARRRRG